MISRRHWNKGSARHAGPKTSSGTVRVRPPGAIDYREVHLCPCGQTQARCDDCGLWVCRATGHAAHVCEVAGG